MRTLLWCFQQKRQRWCTLKLGGDLFGATCSFCVHERMHANVALPVNAALCGCPLLTPSLLPQLPLLSPQVCHELPAAASQAIFQEAFRVLRPGGALAVMVRL